MYHTYSEYTEDLLTFLDMCLYSVADEKRRGKRLLMGVVAYEENAGGYEQENGRDYLELIREKYNFIKAETAITKEKGNNDILWFDRFCDRFEFDKWQRFLLLIILADHLDREYERVYSYIQDNPDAVWPTLGLAWSLYQYIFHNNIKVMEYPEKLLPDGFLLNEIREDELLSGMALPLKLNRAVLRYLGLSARRNCICLKAWENPDCIPVYEDKIQYMEMLLAGWKEELGKWTTPDRGVMCICGESGTGRHTIVKTACDRAGIPVYFLDCADLPENEEDVLLEISVAARLEGALLCMECFLADDAEKRDKLTAAVKRLSELMGHFAVITESPEHRFLINGMVRIDIEIPFPGEKQRYLLWEYFLKKNRLETDAKIEMLAENYLLPAEKIRQIVSYIATDRDVRNKILKKTEDTGKVNKEDIRRAVSVFTPNLLGESAVKINAGYTWSDIVLDESQKRILKHICDRYRMRSFVENEKKLIKKSPYGNGISAIFHGAPGTGKTMAVQVMANELSLDVYRVDLSKLVSKYIGETEKNMSELFDKAKKANVILFFDEADSLFAKRTEVRSVYDRNANMESAHLLQKIEEYEGIVILATNLPENIDTAFMRRIKYSIQFYLPDRDMRKSIWQKMIPPGMETGNSIDLDYYAEFMKVTGSDIKEIYTSAVYIAAAENVPLEDKHIREAVSMYSTKLGGVRLLND